MANKKATKRWNRIAGEPAGSKGLVRDFLFPQDQGREHGDHPEGEHRTNTRENNRTRSAV